MTRTEALEHFRLYVNTLWKDYEIHFWEALQKNKDTLEHIVQNGFLRLEQQIQQADKKEIVHFQFSLLRIDLLQNQYTVLLQASNVDWYLDEETISVSLDIGILFETLNYLRDELFSESKKYVGKVNKYDVQELVSEKIMAISPLIAHTLRFILRDIEQNKSFQMIPKADFWVIRWGEYRDQSEIILQVDHYEKTKEDWENALKEIVQKEDSLIYSFWYRLEVKEGYLKNKQLHFIGFEESHLENINFESSAILGARFKKCYLKNCSFKGALLKYSDFRTSHFENVDFSDANLTDAIFSEKDVPYLHLSPQQLQIIHIERSL